MSAEIGTPSAGTAASAAPPRGGWREWTALGVLALPTLLLSLDISVLHLALPALVADLRPSGTQLLWITDVYGFMIAGFLVTMGTLGDRIGRRRLLLMGATAFAAASAAAAWTTSPEMLIAARALMGVAGATLMPSTLALISNIFVDTRQRGTAIAVWMSCFSAGMALGPLVGGALLEAFWWGSVFLLGVPVMALLVVCAPVLLPEHRDPEPGRVDLPSVGLSLAAILPGVYGMKEVAAHGPSTTVLVALVFGIGAGTLFLRRQRRIVNPLVDLALFARPAFRVALGAVLVATLVMGGVALFVTLYLQLVTGLTPLAAGLWLVPPALGIVTGSMLAPGLARRTSSRTVMSLGLAVSAIGFLALILVEPGTDPTLLIAGYSVAFFGVAPVGVLGTELVVNSAPSHRAGSAAALSETTGELGIALGIATLGSVGTAVYASRTGGSTLVTDGTVLAPTAQEAFTAGLGAVALVSLIAVAATAVAFRGVRHTEPTHP